MIRRNLNSPFFRRHLELLEARDVPAVDLLGIPNSDFPTNKPLFVPVTVNTADGPVTYNVTSSNPGVTAEVLTGGRSVEFAVSGKDSTNAVFTGTITIRLFENVAPLAQGLIIPQPLPQREGRKSEIGCATVKYPRKARNPANTAGTKANALNPFQMLKNMFVDLPSL